MLIKEGKGNQQSVDSTGNGVPLNGLIRFAPQFESQESRLCWENMCLTVRAETSSLGCGTDLKVTSTVGALPRIPRGQKKKRKESAKGMKVFCLHALALLLSLKMIQFKFSFSHATWN